MVTGSTASVLPSTSSAAPSVADLLVEALVMARTDADPTRLRELLFTLLARLDEPRP